MKPCLCLPGLILAMLACSGCNRLEDPVADMLPRAKVQVAGKVLDQYAGTYRLPSGAHFPVVHEGSRLLGGTPPHELLAQTTRQFTSYGLHGELHFERNHSSGEVFLRQRVGEKDYICERIDPEVTRDPTRHVAVSDHQLRMLIAGTGSPTIVLEDGFGDGIDGHAGLQAELAKLSTVVAYDHASTGGSDPGPAPRDALHVERELRLALENAGLAPPFVLIGHSIGGDYIRIFAHEFPADTAGLILLDPTPDWDEMNEWAMIHAPARAETYRKVRHDLDAFMDRHMELQDAGRSAEWVALDTTRAQSKQAFPLPNVPLVQISGASHRQTDTMSADKIDFFDAWLEQHMPRAKHVLATHSGHGVQVTDQKLVLDEVKQMVTALRQKARK
jgi:pimeloyl-ACP methyl ester carboxylesterase